METDLIPHIIDSEDIKGKCIKPFCSGTKVKGCPLTFRQPKLHLSISTYASSHSSPFSTVENCFSGIAVSFIEDFNCTSEITL